MTHERKKKVDNKTKWKLQNSLDVADKAAAAILSI